MRLARGNLVLAALVALLAGIDLATLPERPPARSARRLFPALEAERAARIELAEGGARLVLERAHTGWILPSEHGHPARYTQVALLLERLAALSDLDVASERRAAWDAHGVGAGALELAVRDAGGALLAGLVQGAPATAARDGRGAASWVRPLGSDAVVRAPRFPRLSVAAQDWLDARWLVFDPARVSALELSGAELGGVRRLERARSERWQDGSGAAIGARGVRDLLEVLAALYFEEVLARGEAGTPAGEPALAIALELEGGERLDARFEAAPAAGGARAAAQGGSEFTVAFSEASYRTVLERARALLTGAPR